jgi:hypothetical protein
MAPIRLAGVVTEIQARYVLMRREARITTDEDDGLGSTSRMGGCGGSRLSWRVEGAQSRVDVIFGIESRRPSECALGSWGSTYISSSRNLSVDMDINEPPSPVIDHSSVETYQQSTYKSPHEIDLTTIDLGAPIATLRSLAEPYPDIQTSLPDDGNVQRGRNSSVMDPVSKRILSLADAQTAVDMLVSFVRIWRGDADYVR